MVLDKAREMVYYLITLRVTDALDPVHLAAILAGPNPEQSINGAGKRST